MSIEPRHTTRAAGVGQMLSNLELHANAPRRTYRPCASGKRCAHYASLGKPYPRVTHGDRCRRCTSAGREALEAAAKALGHQRRTPRRDRAIWTRLTIVEAFCRFYAETGFMPNSLSLEVADYLPSRHAVQRRFGGLEAARRATWDYLANDVEAA